MAPGRYYVDTSAYLCVLLGEAGWEGVAKTLEGGHLLSSVLLALEAQRTLVQLSRGGRLSPDAVQNSLDRLSVDLAQFDLRDLTLDLCHSRTMPIVTTPRSLDLAHLRTAMWFHEQEPLTRFVSLDAAQTQAARELGLPV
jgi:PIN domain nuclease of toxin-antitoxin system